MLLTEYEANTKECRVGIERAVTPPLPWQSAAVGFGGPIYAPEPVFHRCSASGCMHWRVGEPAYEVAKVSEDSSVAPGPPAGNGWERHMPGHGPMVWRRVKALRGYCGLAGRP